MTYLTYLLGIVVLLLTALAYKKELISEDVVYIVAIIVMTFAGFAFGLDIAEYILL